MIPRKLLKIDGFRFKFTISGHGIDAEIRFWKTYEAYDAVEDGEAVFLREQTHKLTGRKRRIVSYPSNHPKRNGDSDE